MKSFTVEDALRLDTCHDALPQSRSRLYPFHMIHISPHRRRGLDSGALSYESNYFCRPKRGLDDLKWLLGYL